MIIENDVHDLEYLILTEIYAFSVYSNFVPFIISYIFSGTIYGTI